MRHPRAGSRGPFRTRTSISDSNHSSFVSELPNVSIVASGHTDWIQRNVRAFNAVRDRRSSVVNRLSLTNAPSSHSHSPGPDIFTFFFFFFGSSSARFRFGCRDDIAHRKLQ